MSIESFCLSYGNTQTHSMSHLNKAGITSMFVYIIIQCNKLFVQIMKQDREGSIRWATAETRAECYRPWTQGKSFSFWLALVFYIFSLFHSPWWQFVKHIFNIDTSRCLPHYKKGLPCEILSQKYPRDKQSAWRVQYKPTSYGTCLHQSLCHQQMEPKTRWS